MTQAEKWEQRFENEDGEALLAALEGTRERQPEAKRVVADGLPLFIFPDGSGLLMDKITTQGTYTADEVEAMRSCSYSLPQKS